MLSIGKMSIEQAMGYFASNEDELYYVENEGTGTFGGKLLTEFALSPQVDKINFCKILYQINPKDNSPLVKHKNLKVAGYDLTFSAPKSLSVLIETTQDKAVQDSLINAHNRAVDRAIQFIEENYLGYQLSDEASEKKRGFQHTGNALYSRFLHDLSRNHDPQLHTHLFFHNMTKDENGNFRALDARKFFNNKYLLGQIYRNELAYNLMEMDVNIRVTNHKEGFFELMSINDDSIAFFSSRAQEIEAEREKIIEENGELNKDQYHKTKISTRKTKNKKIDREAIRHKNRERMDFVQSEIDIYKDRIDKKYFTSDQCVELAVKAITEHEGVFKNEELLRSALKLGLENSININEIIATIEINKNLIKLANGQYTTKEINHIESLIIDSIINGNNASQRLVDDVSITNELESYNQKLEKSNGYRLTSEQELMVKSILESQDTFTFIQGDAGVGKTASMKAVKRILANQSPYTNIYGLSFTGKAQKILEADTSIKSSTIHRFLKTKRLIKNSLIIVDEASMIGSRQFHEIVRRAEKYDCKVVFLGDRKQFRAVSAGALFDRLQNMKDVCNFIDIKKSIRAQSDKLKEIYKLLEGQEYAKAFDSMRSSGMIKQDEESKLKTFQLISENYYPDTLVITSNNRDKKALNTMIRRQFLHLDDSDIIKELNKSVDRADFELFDDFILTGIDKYVIENYKETENQTVFVGADIVIDDKTIVKAGTVAHIKSIDTKTKSIEIEYEYREKMLETQVQISIPIEKNIDNITIYQKKSKNIVVGEKIIFKKNDIEMKIFNGETAFVEEILPNKNEITVRKESGQRIKINLNKYAHIDYGYAISNITAQGATAKNVVAYVDSSMATSNSFYTEVTRASHNVVVYTDSIHDLRNNILDEQEKGSSTDFLSDLDAHKQEKEEKAQEETFTPKDPNFYEKFEKKEFEKKEQPDKILNKYVENAKNQPNEHVRLRKKEIDIRWLGDVYLDND